MSRLLIFHHFNPHHRLSSYVPNTLARIKPFFSHIIFVSNSRLSEEMTRQLSTYCHQIIQRENKGFDFGGWRDAIFDYGKQQIQQYDSLTLMNDTCFGPLSDMQQVFDTMESICVDFWGLTRHRYAKSGMPGTDGQIPEHIQSYFLTFNQKVLESNVFYDFFSKVADHTSVNKVIKQSETRLTKVLVNAGFMFNTYMDQINRGKPYGNYAIYLEPDYQVKMGNPFIKIKSFLTFKDPIYLKELIGEYAGYRISMIDEHIQSVFPPHVSIHVINKCILIPAQKHPGSAIDAKVAMHFHVSYVDIFKEHILPLMGINHASIDLFITTDSLEKKKAIESFLDGMHEKLHLKRVVITENKGRDVYPWLFIAQMLEGYDYVGHFHTKKSLSDHEWIGDSWMREIMESMVYRSDVIFKVFSANPQVGIIIPDIPRFYKNTQGVDIWDKTKTLFKQLWKRMGLSTNLNPDDILSPVMSYGNMFWYRPSALKPLMDLHLTSDDFPEEPLANDGTLAHAIESIPVYIAWSQGYDFRVMIHPKNIYSGFNYNYFAETIRDLKAVYHSPSWRIGRFIMWFPGKIYRNIQRVKKQHVANQYPK